MPKNMTAREFVVNNMQCPVCRSKDVSWNTIEVHGNSTYQEAHCLECGIGFSTVSRLVGFLIHGAEEPETIKEDFPEPTSIEEPVDEVRDELHRADVIIRTLSRQLREARRATLAGGNMIPEAEMALRYKERAKLLKGKL